MPNHLNWILTCPDNNTSLTLVYPNEPVGVEDCMYRLERHSVYHGIFNQFTSNLKWYNDGGGKEFIDGIYDEFDIDGRIYVEVQIDTTGMGDFETLFNGKLNLASYSEDGTYTTVNIEASDIITKLNTRADIPVPLNVVNISVPGQTPFNAVIIDEYVAADNEGITTGTFTFQSLYIIAGNTFVIATTDTNGDTLSTSVYYDGTSVSSPNITQAGTELQITDITDGNVEIAFVNAEFSNIILYLKGINLSLGQNSIEPAETRVLELAGIPVLYESQFVIKGNDIEGTRVFADDGVPGHTQTDLPITAGHTYTIYGTDASGQTISDSVFFNGIAVTGAGASSNGSFLQIAVSGATVTVTYININGDLDLWQDINVPLASYTVVANNAIQETVRNEPTNLQRYLSGFHWFETSEIFDNFNEFFFTAGNDVTGTPNHTSANTSLPPIFNGFNDPILVYPLQVFYNIRLKGSYTQSIGDGTVSINRDLRVAIVLYWGADFNNPQTFTFYSDNVNTAAGSYTFNFDFNNSGSILLNQGDKIWFAAFLVNSTLAASGTSQDMHYRFEFEESNIDFKIVTNARQTGVLGLMIHEAFTQIVDSIADSDNNFYSEFYGRTDSSKRTYASDGDGAFRFITNGLCIRGRQDKLISLTLNEMFKSMQAIDNIGLTVNSDNLVRVEKLSFFYDANTEMLSLPSVPDYKTVNENSLYVNQIAIGYDKFETEIFFKNGLDEIHGQRNLSTRVGSAKGTVVQQYGDTALPKTQNKLERISKLIAGNYAIELTRRKNKRWFTDDFKYDNDNFIVCVSRVATGQVSFLSTAALNLYQLVVQGNVAYQAGQQFTVTGSPTNDGTYTVLFVSYAYTNGTTGIPAQTYIGVVESVNAEVAPSCTITLLNSDVVPEIATNILQDDIENVVNPVMARNWLNLSITPARMLQACMNVVTAGLQKIKGNIQFLNGKGNYTALTELFNTGKQEDYTGNPLYENQSLDYADPLVRNIAPIWGTEIYTFEYPLTYTQFQTVLANPHGYVVWNKFAGVNRYGFIRSMEYNIHSGLTKFELIKIGGDEGVVLLDEFNSPLIPEQMDTLNVL